MSEEKKSFFQTLPGILTGFATLITAVVALLYAMAETGILLKPATHPETQNENQTVTEASTGTTEEPSQPTTDGWAIIGKTSRGRYFDMKIEYDGASPAIGRKYKALETFRLRQRGPNDREGRAITLGMVHDGDTVEVLDLNIDLKTSDGYWVYAKLRATLHELPR